jgi:hypothetical protein
LKERSHSPGDPWDTLVHSALRAPRSALERPVPESRRSPVTQLPAYSVTPSLRHFVTPSLRHLPSRSPNPAVPQSPSYPVPRLCLSCSLRTPHSALERADSPIPASRRSPVTQLPSHVALPLSFTPHSALRIPHWKVPIPQSRFPNPESRLPAVNVSHFSEMRLTSIGTCPKASNSMQEASKTDTVPSKKMKNGPSFVLPILTFRGSNPLGASVVS